MIRPRVRYTGPDARLQGKTALALPPSESDPEVLQVQFDDLTVPEAIGWHAMPATYFQAVPEVETSHG